MNALHGLSVWNRACGLAVQTCAALSECRDRAFRDAITRASVALPAGIAVGYELAPEFPFDLTLEQARANCSELRTLLYIAAELDLIPLARSTELMQESVEIARMLHALAESGEAHAPTPPRRRRNHAERRADL